MAMDTRMNRLTARINWLWRLMMTGCCFVLFGVGGLLLSLVWFNLLLIVQRDRAKRRRLARRSIAASFRFFLAIARGTGVLDYRINNLDALRNDRGCLVIANHPTLIDYVILASVMKIPEIEHHQVQPQKLEVILHLDPSLFWFQGHFAVQPLLPGVAQLDWVMHYATTLLAPGYRFHSIQNVKFQAPLLPEATVTLTLEWNAERQMLTFSYQRHAGAERHTASSGKIRLCQ